MKYNFRTPHLLLALAFAVGVISLTPAGGGEFSQASLTRGLLAEETTSTDTTNTDTTTTDTTTQPETVENPVTTVECDSATGANCGSTTTQPADNYNYNPQPVDNYNQQPYNDYNTSGGGGCAPGTTCDGGGGYNNGGEGGGSSSPQDWMFDLRDARRMVNEISHMIKQRTKQNADTTELNSLLTQVSEIKATLETSTSLTWEELDQIRQTLHGEMGMGGISAILECIRREDESARMLKDQERMEKDFSRTMEDLDRMGDMAGDMADEIATQKERMTKMLELNEQMISLMQNSSCGSGEDDMDIRWEIDDKRMEIDDLRMEMDDFWPKMEEIRTTGWASQMFDQVETDIAKGREDYANMPPEMQKKFDVLSQVATDLVAKGRACLTAGDIQCVKEFQIRLEELGRKANQIFGGSNVDFEQMGFDKNMNEKFQTMAGDKNFGEAAEIIQSFLKADPTILNNLLNKLMEIDPAAANKIFKIMGRMPEDKQSEYLSQQNELTETLDEAIATAPQLKTYKEEILNSNLVGDVLTEAITTLEDVRDGAVQATEFIESIPQLIVENKTEAYNEGISNFKDVSLGDWYDETAHDEDLNISGKIINGEAMFDPSGQVTYAEALKVVAETVGLEKTDGTSISACQKHWAAGYCGAVEGKGITIANNLDQKMTRGEVARMIVEITGLQMQDVQTPFTDLAGNKYESFIETLYGKNIMNGNPDNTVRPNDPINRAETFTLFKNMKNNLGLEVTSIEAIQAIETMKVDVDMNTEIDMNMDVKMDMDNGNYNYDNGGGSYDNYDNGGGSYNDGIEDTSDEMFDMMDWE